MRRLPRWTPAGRSPFRATYHSDVNPAASIGLLRLRGGHAHARVTNIELFFDLVFVFAVTQLSHTLLAHLGVRTAVETTLLFLAVWWVWIYTTWCTNWLDPDHTVVRLLVFALMLAGLLLACSLPHAFDHEGPLFAWCYVVMQVGRTLFMVWAVSRERRELTRNFQRVTVWLVTSGMCWIAGTLWEGDRRLGLWALAIAIEYGSVWAGFWVPGLGRSRTRDWDIAGAHLAERCSLFIMIALGESIVVIGATAAAHPATWATVSAFAVAFVGSVAMWWIYFHLGYETGTRQIATTDDPGRIGRLAYTYLHIPIVAGIVVAAVSDELVLAHPAGHVDAKFIATTLGGAALFLVGNLAFKAVLWRRAPLSHLVGFGLLALTGVFATVMTPLGLATAVMALLLVVATWETLSLRRAATP
jgi:low temperature requirement protein LtrA